MAKDIDSYLRELQAALAGADPALIQDALFDAEEHLQEESAALEASRGTSPAEAEARFATVMEDYGTPEEVAAAYLGAPLVGGVSAERAAAPVLGRGPVEGGGPAGGAAAVDAAAVALAPVGVAPVVGGASRGGPVPGAPAPSAVGAGGAAAPTAAAGIQPGVWERFFGVVIDPRVYKALLYMILSLGTGIAYFTIVVTGLSLSGGMIVLVIGLPLLLLFLGVVRGMSLFEGRLVEVLLGTRMPRRPRAEPHGAGLVQRMWFWVKDGRTWLAMVYMLLQLPLGIAYFTVAVTGLATGAYLIALPFSQLAVGHTYINYGVSHEFLFHTWQMPFSVIVGALLLVVWLHLIRVIGRGHAAYAKGMLVRLVK